MRAARRRGVLEPPGVHGHSVAANVNHRGHRMRASAADARQRLHQVLITTRRQAQRGRQLAVRRGEWKPAKVVRHGGQTRGRPAPRRPPVGAGAVAHHDHRIFERRAVERVRRMRALMLDGGGGKAAKLRTTGGGRHPDVLHRRAHRREERRHAQSRHLRVLGEPHSRQPAFFAGRERMRAEQGGGRPLARSGDAEDQRRGGSTGLRQGRRVPGGCPSGDRGGRSSRATSRSAQRESDPCRDASPTGSAP